MYFYYSPDGVGAGGGAFFPLRSNAKVSWTFFSLSCRLVTPVSAVLLAALSTEGGIPTVTDPVRWMRIVGRDALAAYPPTTSPAPPAAPDRIDASFAWADAK